MGHADGEHLEPYLQLYQRPVEAALSALGAHTGLAPQAHRIQWPVLQNCLVDRLGFGRHLAVFVLGQEIGQ
jgi:hypothetical protein